MTAAIMPVELHRGNSGGFGFVQNAFQILLVILHIIVVSVVFGPTEEVCRRQLLGISHDNRLTASCDGTNGVPRCDLRGLIENHNVENRLVGRQILGNRKWRHQKTRRQLTKVFRHPTDEFSNRFARPL